MTQSLNGKFVSVGDFVGEEMEYLSEDPTTFEENGKLFASIPGIVEINPNKRTIKIKNSLKKRIEIKIGDYVIGKVSMERKFTVGLRIYKVGNFFVLKSNKFANVHVSNVSKQYIERLSEAFKKTDVVRARVIGKVGKEYELTTQGQKLGVISCDCTVCGTNLNRKGRDFLECPFCGKREKRKIASDYGSIEEKFEF